MTSDLVVTNLHGDEIEHYCHVLGVTEDLVDPTRINVQSKLETFPVYLHPGDTYWFVDGEEDNE